MAKIETIKNEFIEFKVFPAAKVYTLFKELHGESILDYVAKNENDIKALCDILYLGHKSASLLLETKPKFEDSEYLQDRLDINDVVNGVALMLEIDLDAAKEVLKDSNKKK